MAQDPFTIDEILNGIQPLGEGPPAPLTPEQLFQAATQNPDTEPAPERKDNPLATLFATLADATGGFAQGLEPRLGRSNASARLQARRENQSNRDATAARQKQRQDFLERTQAVRTVEGRNARDQQNSQFNAAQELRRELADKADAAAAERQRVANEAIVERDAAQAAHEQEMLRLTQENDTRALATNQKFDGLSAAVRNEYKRGSPEQPSVAQLLESGKSPAEILELFRDDLDTIGGLSPQMMRLRVAEMELFIGKTAEAMQAKAKQQEADKKGPGNFSQGLGSLQRATPTGLLGAAATTAVGPQNVGFLLDLLSGGTPPDPTLPRGGGGFGR